MSFVVGLIPQVRPFLSGLGAAIKEPVELKGPIAPGRMREGAEHLVWTRQVDRCLRWIRAFLEGTAGALTIRVIHLSDLKFVGRFKASVDASPWGIGGISRTAPASWQNSTTGCPLRTFGS